MMDLRIVSPELAVSFLKIETACRNFAEQSSMLVSKLP